VSEQIPSQEEIDAEISALKKILDYLEEKIRDRIKSLEEAKEAFKKSQQAGMVKYELPSPKQGQERLFRWLEGMLQGQQEKGHIQNLKIEVQGDKTVYMFNPIKKEDLKDVEGWFTWVKKHI
jgi:hypothetical protein